MDKKAVSCINLGGKRKLNFKSGPLVMGILNCTPDSFFPGSRTDVTNNGLNKALEMISNEVDILDIGGESSRPGSDYVSAEKEIARVIPLIQSVRQKSDILISVDTRKAVVAEKALDAGADIINDISALSDDPDLALLAAEKKVPVILMHKRGTPLTMQNNPSYSDTVGEIIKELLDAVELALKAGVSVNKIILDPGIGFGKRYEDNLIILKELKRIKNCGYPVLIGASRKSFIGTVLSSIDGKERPVEGRLSGSLAANAYSAIAGADILRVHDVKETVDMVKILKSIMAAGHEEK